MAKTQYLYQLEVVPDKTKDQLLIWIEERLRYWGERGWELYPIPPAPGFLLFQKDKYLHDLPIEERVASVFTSMNRDFPEVMADVTAADEDVRKLLELWITEF